MEYVLKTNGIVKTYKGIVGSHTALDGVDMNVPKGSVYGFVGRNGAGKTTFIRIITGLQLQNQGSFELFGEKSGTDGIYKARRRLGAIVETPSVHPKLSAKENLLTMYKIAGIPEDSRIDELLSLVGLEGTGSKKAKDFSLGMKQRLGIAMALCTSPDMLILDEPINGLDPQGIVEIRELILNLNREKNITVLISSHILDELSKLATHYGFINQGRIVMEMSAEELMANCKKSLSVTVSSITALTKYLDENGLEYKTASDNTAEIYSPITLSKLVADLGKNGCEVLKANESEESLESFFINLVGGEQ